MPPSAAADNEVVGGGNMGALQEYADRLEGGAVVKITKDLQFSTADFRPVKALGNGDMGSVFLVAQRSNNAPYAMKVMNKEVLVARKNGHRAQAEKDILAAVNHPFLPVLHSHFEDEKHNFLVMNYCHGGDLNVLRQRQPERRFSESACRFYIAEVLLALEYLHKRKIVYRDLKPENILIQSGGHVMLTDFDLSLDLSERNWTKPETGDKISSSSPVKSQKKPSRGNHVKAFFACGSPMSISKKSTSKKGPNSRVTPEEAYIGRKRASGTNNDMAAEGPANSFVGTEEYVAPEIIWGKGHGLPVDWWTLGILLYELYYGKTPFKGVNRKETFYSVLCKPVIYPGYPNDLTDLIRKLLVKEPEERLGTKGGAEEIKKHPFFNGVNWDELQNLSRTPVVPDFFSWEQIEKDLAAKAAASGKEVQTRWSFCETTDPIQEKEKDSSTKSPSGPLSLKSNNNSSSYQDRLAETLIAKHFMRMDSDASTWSLEDDGSSDDTFVLDRQAEMYKQLTSTISPKEEVRLDSYDVLIEQKLFEDVF